MLHTIRVRKQNISALGFIALGLAQPVLAAESLCGASETIYFSCRVKGDKLVSLCGSADVSWLQYRFGQRGSVEMTYPTSRQDSVSKFQGDYGTAQQGQARWTSVSFLSAGIGYKVEYLVPIGKEPFEEVKVGDPKKMDISLDAVRRQQYPTANILCTGKSNSSLLKFDALTRFLVNGEAVR